MPRMNMTLSCERCAAEYRPNYPPKGHAPSRFCSAACSTAARFGEAPDLRCATCNAPITAKGRTRKYCSMACRNEGKRGRPSPKRKGWDDYPAPVRDPVSGCLRWQGPHHSNGYGTLSSTKYAHREAWEREVGPIPAAMTIDHVADRGCIHRDCVEVAHLEVVTQSVNTSRSARSIEQRARTHCPQDHPYAGKNLIVRKGKRECRACHYAGIERRRLAGKVEARS